MKYCQAQANIKLKKNITYAKQIRSVQFMEQDFEFILFVSASNKKISTFDSKIMLIY